MSKDNYIKYIDDFFNRWIKLYDLFALSIFNVYSATVSDLALRENDKFLDICTGTGEVALRVADKFFHKGVKVTAIDITEVMLNKACEKAKSRDLKIDFKKMDARKLEFPDNYFDVVSISNALHDMPRRVRIEVLKEAKRVCNRRLVIADYDFPKNPIIFNIALRIINLFETPYFKSYVIEGLEPLLLESNIEAGKSRKILPNLFSVRSIDINKDS